MRTGKLMALEVARLMREGKPGLKNDGGGLYLKDGSSWIYRYERNGKKHDFGLGPALDVALAEARRKAAEARRLLHEGRDPLAEKRASRASLAPVVTLEAVGAEYIEAHRAGWSAKHRNQWASSLANIIYPVIGDMLIASIGVADVLRVLTPLWSEKPETADRVRNRLETLLDAAKARGLRSGDNPARWKGHLDHLLPRTSKLRTVEHFAAIDYHAMSEFMAGLREQSGSAPAALDFTILTACRSGEVMGATWDEIDLDQSCGSFRPRGRRRRKEHRVPLSDAAMAVLADMAAIRMNEYVFPGQRGQLSHRMLQLALQRTRRADITVHGFRSAFRDWSGNETHIPREVCEAALGHSTGNAVEAAYRRSDALDKRRALMDAWAGIASVRAATSWR